MEGFENSTADARRHFPCEGCGADLEFDAGQQQLKCPYCGFEKELALAEDASVEEQDLEAALSQVAEGHKKSHVGELELSCKGCGGTVSFSGVVTTTECAFCGLPVQRDDVHAAEDRWNVDGVLPFKVSHDEAQQALRAWVDGLWFAPNEFKKRGVSGKFNGIYMPFWTFDAQSYCRYSGERGENYTVTVGSGKNRRTETRTRWHSVSGNVQHFHDDELIVATSHFDEDLLNELEPWPLAEIAPFNPELLAGFQAMTYDVGLRDGFITAQERFDETIRSLIRRDIGGDKQRIHDMQTRLENLAFKHLLLPVWVLSYRHDDKVYQVVVNARTGEVQGQRPWSPWKIALASLFAAILAAAFLWVMQKN